VLRLEGRNNCLLQKKYRKKEEKIRKRREGWIVIL
jgi:hypothetical protein